MDNISALMLQPGDSQSPHAVIKHSHGHAKLLQPLLLQLFGLEEELKAILALVVGEVESVGPLQ